MLKLIRLEWKKHRIGSYTRNAVILTAGLVAFALLAVCDGAFDQIELGAEALHRSDLLLAFIDTLTHMSYVIFTGVMLSAFLVGDYCDKTIYLLFSYPIRRQKLLLAKMLAVWSFSFAALTLCKLAICGALLLANAHTHVSAADLRMGELSFWLRTLLGSAAMVSISYAALLVGLKLKSSRAVIVAAVILACLTQGSIGEFSLADSALFYAILMPLAVVSVVLSLYNVEGRDV